MILLTLVALFGAGLIGYGLLAFLSILYHRAFPWARRRWDKARADFGAGYRAGRRRR